MDISGTLQPNSDQLDAIELISPRTFVIERVSAGSAEQPVNIHLVGFPRPWRPGKSMRRVLPACWGTDASLYIGRRVNLFRDPDVTFGKDKVGGTRISHLSHLERPKRIPLLVSRGQSMTYTVDPLPAATSPTPVPPATPALTDDEIEAATTVPELRRMWPSATPAQQERIKARVAELTEEPSS